MTNLIIFDSADEKKIKELHESMVYYGRVYVIEYMSGKVKIGATGNLERRMKDLKHWCCEYGEAEFGRVAVTEDCTNYYEIERKLHEIFSEYREGKNEKFNICFDEVVNKIKKIDLPFKHKKETGEELFSQVNDKDFEDFVDFVSSLHLDITYSNDDLLELYNIVIEEERRIKEIPIEFQESCSDVLEEDNKDEILKAIKNRNIR